jgi:hypothetical protein
MFYLGENIASKEQLKGVTPNALYAFIKDDDFNLQGFVQRARELCRVDKGAYSLLKKKLPYFCIASFKDNQRRIENLIEAKYLILDFDQLSLKQIDDAKDRIVRDSHTYLCYESPSGAGLKVVLKLGQTITSAKEYSNYYKTVGLAFAHNHGLSSFLDITANDATRASFICPDFSAYFNPNCEPVNTASQGVLVTPKSNTEESKEETPLNTLDDGAYEKILNRLKKKSTKSKINKPLNDTMQRLLQFLEPLVAVDQMNISEANPIQFGMQLRICHNQTNFGEVNIYHGKKGFSVVRSMKGDTVPLLNEVLEKFVWLAINNMFNKQDAQLLRKI